jgi:hypothetical protein
VPAYAPLLRPLAAAWLAAWLGHAPLGGAGRLPLKLLHGHEFVFGFAAAIILGVVSRRCRAGPARMKSTAGDSPCWSRCGWPGASRSGPSPWLPAPLPALADGLLYPAQSVCWRRNCCA